MSDLQGKRVFVSGGAGVIGSELIPQLHAQGAVVLVGDLKPRPRDWPGAVQYRQGDLNHMTVAEIASFRPEVFIHLAATFERSTETYGFWSENFQHNVALSHHLMTIHKDLDSLKRVIFASSYLIYDPVLYSFDAPQAKARRLNETDPILPRNLTGMAKLAHEIELRFLKGFRQEQFSTVIARIYRGYGRGSHCVISRWIGGLLKGEPIKVYRPEGLFDYIFAGDTAEGLLKLAEHTEVEGIINLGTDRSRRVADVVEVLRQHFPNMKAETCDSDIPFEASQANMDRFRATIGWAPQRQLEDAIPLIIAYQKSAMEGKQQPAGNVMISSAAKKIPLLREVRRAGQKLALGVKITAADACSEALSQHFADGFWKMPLLRDLSASDLLKYCREHLINAIIPTRDGELGYFAKHRDLLAAGGVSVMVSDAQVVEICLDKLKFAEFCQAAAIPAIATKDSLASDAAGQWVVKERFGAGSQSIGLNLNAEQALAHASQLSSPIFQPFVAGVKEYSADVYVDRQGQMKGCVVRSRDVIERGESQVTTTVDCPPMAAACQALIEKLKCYGHLIFQAFVSENGEVQIIECNPRFGGASSLALAAGLDSFFWFLLEANGADVSGYVCTCDPKRPLRQIRFAQDMIQSV